VVLTVHDDNERARALYRSYGFEETGEELDGELVMVLPDR
jgi:ribosomal protein S18 acetylase RimI-like enzyme